MRKIFFYKHVREIFQDGDVVATGGFMRINFAGKIIIDLEIINPRDQRSHLYDIFHQEKIVDLNLSSGVDHVDVRKDKN